jgi:hypothetical protein
LTGQALGRTFASTFRAKETAMGVMETVKRFLHLDDPQRAEKRRLDKARSAEIARKVDKQSPRSSDPYGHGGGG